LLGFLGVLIILRPGIEASSGGGSGVLVASLGYAASTSGPRTHSGQSTLAIPVLDERDSQIGMR